MTRRDPRFVSMCKARVRASLLLRRITPLLFAVGCGAASGTSISSNGADMQSQQAHQAPAAHLALGATTPLHFGRFVLDAPFGVRAGGDRAHLQTIEVAESDWPAAVTPARDRTPPAAGSTPAARAWDARVAELESGRAKRPESGGPVVIAVRQIAPNVRLLYRHDGRFNPRLVAAEALADFGTYGLWIRSPYRVGSEDSVAKYFGRLAESYHPAAELGRAGDGTPMFHLTRGAFVLPYDIEEGVSMTLDVDPRYGVRHAAVETRSGRDPEWGIGLVADWRGRLASDLGSTRSELVRAGDRTVAGLDGEEVVARIHQAQATTLALEFAYPGEKGEPLRPQFTMTVNTSPLDAAGEARVLLLWDQLLGTVRVPQRNSQLRGGRP